MQNYKSVELYTCLYITNKCINNCGYCGFRRSNNSLDRITLSPEEVRAEAIAIRKSGVKHVIIIGGTLEEEEYKYLVLESTKIVIEEGLIPWIEFENLSFDTLKKLKLIGADHFILFQETYNEEIFAKLHRDGSLKGNFSARLGKMDEAVDAGFKNIGVGALFGLTNDYDFEIQELCKHAKALQNKGANAMISLATLNQAKVSSKELQRITAKIRLALPNISIMVSGRERERDKLFPLIDYVGTGGVTFPGGRTVHKNSESLVKQFNLGDTRTPKEIISFLKSININVKE